SRLDFGKALAGRAAGRAAPEHARGERIVATGVEDKYLDAARVLEAVEQTAHAHSFIVDVFLVGELGLDGDEIVDAFHLHAVPGIVDYSPVGSLGGFTESLQSLQHAALGQIE